MKHTDLIPMTPQYPEFRLHIDALSIRRHYRFIIQAFNAHFSNGMLVHLKGENGAGKTTLLRAIAQLTPIHSGRIDFNEQPVHHALSFYYQQILYLGHQLGLKPELSPSENLKSILAIRNSNDHLKMIESTLALMKLPYSLRPLRYYSAGQQRRVGLCRLWLENRPIWLLDEPFTALDQHTITLVEAIIQQHCQRGGLVIMTSHQKITLNYPHQSIMLSPALTSLD